MKKWQKRLIIASSIVLTILITLGIPSYLLFLHHYKGKKINNIWNEEDVFDISKIKTVNKKKGEDFTILNLADIQMTDFENWDNHIKIHDEITYLVNLVKPDLITLTGDQVWFNEQYLSLQSLINWLDGYKIPYAPVFGNHDHGNDFSSAVAGLNYSCDLYEGGKYSLFSRGPTNVDSMANYAINIMEDGKIYKTLYMVDSGYLNIINDKQKSYFSWIADGIKANNNNQYAGGMAFLHKPLPEYYLALQQYRDGADNAIGDVHVHFSARGSEQNGFFEMMKEKGLEDVICGHQHGNSFTLIYEGVRLTNSLKTGENCSYYNDGVVNLNGATSFTLKDEGTLVNNHYVEQGQFHFSNKNNVYKN